MSYEFWYYAIYATCFYFVGWRKVLAATAALLIAGPKIILLLPVWMLGVIVYHLSRKLVLGRSLSFCLVVLPILAYCFYRGMHVHEYFLRETVEVLGRDFVFIDLKWSQRFLNAYVVGTLFAIHMLGVYFFANGLNVPRYVEKPIRYFAATTFVSYLFHYPLLQLFGSIFKNGIVIVLLTFIAVLLIAPFTEGNKKEWRKIIEGLTRRSGHLDPVDYSPRS